MALWHLGCECPFAVGLLLAAVAVVHVRILLETGGMLYGFQEPALRGGVVGQIEVGST
jgi:hypothetical protein